VLGVARLFIARKRAAAPPPIGFSVLPLASLLGFDFDFDFDFATCFCSTTDWICSSSASASLSALKCLALGLHY
jgi:hypothetical protein